MTTQPQTEDRDTYRFDDACGQIFRWSPTSAAYLFLGSYIAYGIRSTYSEAHKILVMNRETTQ